MAGILLGLALAIATQGALAQSSARGDAPPFPPARPFDLMVPGGSPLPPRAATPPATAAEDSPAPPQTAVPGVVDPAPRIVSGAPLPPSRPAEAPRSNPEDEEEEPDAPWPRRTPGQRSLEFEPRVPPQDEVIANGISTDPGTSITCLPAQLKRVLDSVVKRYGSVRVTSTFRPVWRARRNSFHRTCRAVDFRVPGQAPRTVLDFLKTLNETGGHKVYWNGILHVDTGPWRTW